jgi:hypothetical protein
LRDGEVTGEEGAAVMKTGIMVLLVGSVLGGVEETVGTAGSRERNGGDSQMQDDILKAMKDSGVLKEWKEKLDKQLFQEEDNSIVDNEQGKKANRKSMISPQERDMLKSFVEEYKADSGLTVDTSIVLSIVERVQKTARPNLPQIFVQLGPIIEVLSAISQKTKDVQKIVDRQAPVFDSPAKPKDVLHTLAENLKSELVRLTLDMPPKGKPARKKSPPPPAKKAAGLDMADYLSLGASLMKGGNAGQMMKMMSGEADMASILSMLPQLMQNGNIKDLLFKLLGSYLESSPYGPLIQQYGRQAMESEQGAQFVDGAYNAFESFIKSDNGIRFTKLVPELLAAKDMDATLRILSKEAEFNWSFFFEKIQNSDYKESVMETVGEFLVMAYDFVQNPPKDSMFTRAPVILNGLLISQRLPALDMKNPVESLTKLTNKCIALFTTWKLDVTPHVTAIADTLTQVYEKQARGNTFSSLSDKEKKSVLARVMDEELVVPVQTVWSVYQHVSGVPRCQEHLLCQVNHREFKAIKPLRPSEASPTRLAVTKGASLAVAWTMAKGNKDEYWRLYKAVYEGAQGGNCMVLYPPVGRTCDLFPWQRKDFMNTQYDHVEL